MSGLDELYSTKALRDTRAKELQGQGYTVKRYSTGRVQLHPRYIEDQKESEAGQDRGFGNTSYRMLWSKLYGVKVIGGKPDMSKLANIGANLDLLVNGLTSDYQWWHMVGTRLGVEVSHLDWFYNQQPLQMLRLLDE